MGYRVAVVGATGAVGARDAEHPRRAGVPGRTRWWRSPPEASAGKEVSFGDDRVLKVRPLEDFDFEGIDLGLFSPGAAVSKVHAPRAAAAGCVVIDNTSQFRMDEDVPLVVPEVNPRGARGLSRAQHHRQPELLDHPDGDGAQAAARPRDGPARGGRRPTSRSRAPGARRWTSCSSRPRASTRRATPEPKHFPKQIAFNVIPQIDVFLDDGAAKEEWKMAVETKKILDPAIEVAATCVRVPVFVGHALGDQRRVRARDRASRTRARRSHEFEGVLLVDDPAAGEYVTPVECVGEYAVFVSRLRKDPTVPHGLSMWIVADNLRKGAALNAVQIAEALVEEGYL